VDLDGSIGDGVLLGTGNGGPKNLAIGSQRSDVVVASVNADISDLAYEGTYLSVPDGVAPRGNGDLDGLGTTH
jgi:hypothetical protein